MFSFIDDHNGLHVSKIFYLDNDKNKYLIIIDINIMNCHCLEQFWVRMFNEASNGFQCLGSGLV